MCRAVICLTIATLGLAQVGADAALQISPRSGTETLSFPCPATVDISPCNCSVENEGPKLDCSLVQSDEELAQVFQQEFPFKEYWQLYIHYNDKIQYLTDILNGVTFQDIDLYHVPNLTFVSDNLLAGSQLVLERISIYKSKLNEDTFSIPFLGVFKKLKQLHISDNDFTIVPETLMSTSLQYFTLESGSISHLFPDTFAYLPNLLNWWFSYQKIKLLRANTFQLQDSFNTISVRGNELSYVEAGTFVLPNTTESLAIYLELSANELTVLDEMVYGEIFPYLTTLVIHDNPLECGCDLAWIITNPDYISKLYGTETCYDGTLLTDLDPDAYTDLCLAHAKTEIPRTARNN